MEPSNASHGAHLYIRFSDVGLRTKASDRGKGERQGFTEDVIRAWNSIGAAPRGHRYAWITTTASKRLHGDRRSRG